MHVAETHAANGLPACSGKKQATASKAQPPPERLGMSSVLETDLQANSMPLRRSITVLCDGAERGRQCGRLPERCWRRRYPPAAILPATATPA